MEEDEALPDHLRCRRWDGRQWCCAPRALDNLSFCELHHLQARRLQNHLAVPDSLKLRRKKTSESGRRRNRGNAGGGAAIQAIAGFEEEGIAGGADIEGIEVAGGEEEEQAGCRDEECGEEVEENQREFDEGSSQWCNGDIFGSGSVLRWPVQAS